jgi:transposase-like protein
MDLAHTFCPNLDCPARGQTGQGNVGIHSRKDQRLICKQCHKTFTLTRGTAFYRLRTPAETVSVVLTLMAHGCPLQAIVVAFGFDERTVAAWFARAGRQAQAVQEHLVERLCQNSPQQEARSCRSLTPYSHLCCRQGRQGNTGAGGVEKSPLRK